MRIIIVLLLLSSTSIHSQKLQPISTYLANKKVSKNAKEFNNKLPVYKKDESKYYGDPKIEEYTSSLVDSTMSKNEATRPFYFYLMNRNSEMVDGSLALTHITGQYEIFEKSPAYFFKYMLANPAEKSKYFRKWAGQMQGFSDQYCNIYLHLGEDTCMNAWRRNVLMKLRNETVAVKKLAREFLNIMTGPEYPPVLDSITAADNGKTRRVEFGGNPFVITLRECRGCQDNWKITSIDTAKLELVQETETNPSCTNCTGGNWDHNFLIKVKAKGMSKIVFTYFEEKISFTIVGE